jgi:hypothetical protein
VQETLLEAAGGYGLADGGAPKKQSPETALTQVPG